MLTVIIEVYSQSKQGAMTSDRRDDKTSMVWAAAEMITTRALEARRTAPWANSWRRQVECSRTKRWRDKARRRDEKPELILAPALETTKSRERDRRR